jgi:hypothetical protein
MDLSNPKAKEFYNKVLAVMRKQYKDVSEITELHVNDAGKVFSAQWLDSNGVTNFCGGYLIDCVKIVKIKK